MSNFSSVPRPDRRKILPAVEIWQLDGVKDLCVESPEVENDMKGLTRFVENCNGFDGWCRSSLALMKGSTWKSHDVFQAFTAIKKEMEASLCMLQLQCFFVCVLEFEVYIMPAQWGLINRSVMVGWSNPCQIQFLGLQVIQTQS